MSRLYDADTENIEVGTWATTGVDISAFIWIQIDSLPTADRRFFQKGNGSAEANTDWMLSNNDTAPQYKPRIRLRRNGSTNTFNFASTLITFPSPWIHAGFTYAGGSNSGIMYHQGSSYATFSHSETTGDISQRTKKIEIGNADTSSLAFFGQAAWFCVWDSVLAPNEVAALFRGRTPIFVRPDKILGCYPLWGTHSPEIDLSPNQRGGVVTGATRGTSGPPVEPFSVMNNIWVDDVSAPVGGEPADFSDIAIQSRGSIPANSQLYALPASKAPGLMVGTHPQVYETGLEIATSAVVPVTVISRAIPTRN